nr:hypothetical protein CFP56_20651 [Quercus suber]
MDGLRARRGKGEDRKDERRGDDRTQDEEAEGVIVLGAVGAPVGVGDAKGRGHDEAEAGVEEAKGGEDGVGVGVAEDDLPLGGDDHADAGDGEEVADEGVGDADAAPAHEGEGEGGEGGGEGADGEGGGGAELGLDGDGDGDVVGLGLGTVAGVREGRGDLAAGELLVEVGVGGDVAQALELLDAVEVAGHGGGISRCLVCWRYDSHPIRPPSGGRGHHWREEGSPMGEFAVVGSHPRAGSSSQCQTNMAPSLRGGGRGAERRRGNSSSGNSSSSSSSSSSSDNRVRQDGRAMASSRTNRTGCSDSRFTKLLQRATQEGFDGWAGRGCVAREQRAVSVEESRGLCIHWGRAMPTSAIERPALSHSPASGTRTSGQALQPQITHAESGILTHPQPSLPGSGEHSSQLSHRDSTPERPTDTR